MVNVGSLPPLMTPIPSLLAPGGDGGATTGGVAAAAAGGVPFAPLSVSLSDLLNNRNLDYGDRQRERERERSLTAALQHGYGGGGGGGAGNGGGGERDEQLDPELAVSRRDLEGALSATRGLAEAEERAADEAEANAGAVSAVAAVVWDTVKQQQRSQ